MAEPAFAHPPIESAACSRCGTELAPTLLVCPSCDALVHAEQLKTLAASAEQAEAERNPPRALALWREALHLLPPNSKQHEAITARIGALGDGAEKSARQAEVNRVREKYKKHGALVTAVAVFLAKFKFLIILLLTKGKLLLLGLTKLSTLGSMAAYMGFRASAVGWQLALGVVLCIYVHEMGHVAANQRHGIKSTAPMFIPGFGAFILAKQPFSGDWIEADIGLAGPIWGLGATLVAYAIFRGTGAQYWSTLAHWSALINLFNLLPIWQLDGAHAFKAMSRPHRIAAAASLLAAAVLSQERMLWLPFIGAIWAFFTMRLPARADVRAVGYYVALVGALSLLAALTPAPI